MPIFSFNPRWREELVCTCAEGAFVLEMTMGRPKPSVYLPTEAVWQKRAPAWAVSYWLTLRDDLESWCRANNNIPLDIDATGAVHPA